MTWPWSHTQEAYENVRENIRNMDIEDLRVIYAEIFTYKISLAIENLIREELKEEIDEYVFNPDDYFNEAVYKRVMESERLKNLCESHEESPEEFTNLSEFIYEYACELRECDNGGFNAYLTPYHSFSVPFDKEKEDVLD